MNINQKQNSLREVISFYSEKGEVLGDINQLPKDIIVYTGFELSGDPHIGTYVSLKRLCSFEKVADYNVTTICLLADFHSFINSKNIILNKEKLISFINKEKHKDTTLLMGFLEDSQGTPGHQQLEEYWNLVFKIFNAVPYNRLKRCITLKNKQDSQYTPKRSELLYIVLQVVDMMILNVNISLGGTDQRKIHMLYSDLRSKYLKKEKLKRIIFIHHELHKDINGIKTSKSLQNYAPLQIILKNVGVSDKYASEHNYIKENIFNISI